MGSLTTTAKNAILDHIYNTAYTPAETMYLSLYIGDPAGAGTEVATDNYARQAITFGAAASRRKTQTTLVSFPQAGGSWGGTISHYGVHTASSAGTMLASGSFTSSFTVVAGNTPKIAIGEVYIEISATASGAGLSDWAANKALDLMFSNTAWSTPKDTLYIAMSSDTLADADDETADFTEQTGTDYARISLPSASMGSASSGAVTNTSAVDLSTPGAADWDAVVALALMTHLTTGNIIAYDNANVADQTPGNGDPIQIAIGDWDHAIS